MKEQGYIADIWKNTKFVCGCHGEDLSNEMVMEQSLYTIYYACKKSHPENLSGDEEKCPNRISVEEYERIIGQITERMMDADENGMMCGDLTHWKWTKNGIVCEILEHNGDHFVVKVWNKKALPK